MAFQIEAPPSGTQASHIVLHTSIFHVEQWDVRAGCSLKAASICYASFQMTDSIYRMADKRQDLSACCWIHDLQYTDLLRIASVGSRSDFADQPLGVCLP